MCCGILVRYLGESFVFETHHFFSQNIAKNVLVRLMTFWYGLIDIFVQGSLDHAVFGGYVNRQETNNILYLAFCFF